MSTLIEHDLNGQTFIDIKDLLPLRPYAIGCTSIPKLINRKQLRDTINGQIINGELVQTARRSYKLGSVYVNKNEIIELFTNPSMIDSPAPPVIEDKNLVFFKDRKGVEYNVLMRGERTQDGIFFRVKDIEIIFQMKRLSETIQHINAGYQDKRDYKWFHLQRNTGFPVNLPSRELYLTYNGIMRVITVSLSGIGKEFKYWIDKTVFAILWGSEQQKVEIFHKVLNVDADHLTAIMKKSGSMISCLYLIDIGITDRSNRIFKYGFTDNINRRFKEHIKKYGDHIKLDKFHFIPVLDLSKAETEFKNSVSRYKYIYNQDDELISLCDEAYINIKTIFGTISAKYCGNMREQIIIYENQIKDLNHKYEMMVFEKDAEISNIQHQCELKDATIALKDKDIEILQLRLMIAKSQ